MALYLGPRRGALFPRQHNGDRARREDHRARGQEAAGETPHLIRETGEEAADKASTGIRHVVEPNIERDLVGIGERQNKIGVDRRIDRKDDAEQRQPEEAVNWLISGVRSLLIDVEGDDGEEVAGTLEARRRTLGAEHRDTLTSMNNLAWSYRAAQRHDEALQPEHEAAVQLRL